jgi:hypothetical protein
MCNEGVQLAELVQFVQRAKVGPASKPIAYRLGGTASVGALVGIPSDTRFGINATLL